MENFEWRNEQRQWDWDNPFLLVEAHLSLPIWGGCPGCNYGDTAMGGLDLSCQAGQITPSLTVWGPGIVFPIGQKVPQGIIKPLASQEVSAFLSTIPLSLEVAGFHCLGKIWVENVLNTPQAWPTAEEGAQFSSPATPSETGLVWKGLRIYFLAVTSKYRRILDLELQGLHVFHY